MIAKLTPDHAARVAFCVATSAEWGVTERALRKDVDLDRMEVFLRGTKRKIRRRAVPVVFPPQQGLLPYALEHAKGTNGMLFAPWTNPAATSTRPAMPLASSGAPSTTSGAPPPPGSARPASRRKSWPRSTATQAPGCTSRSTPTHHRSPRDPNRGGARFASSE